MTRAWSIALTIFAGFWLLVLAGLPLYVFPPAAEVSRSDVALVLGPPMEERLALAEELHDKGLVDEIVVSVQASGGQAAKDLVICREGRAACEVADPHTTRGEVLMMRERATGATAPSLIVVTQTAHVARTRYLFAKCYPGEVTVVAAGGPQSLSEWTSQYVYQSLAFVKAIVQPCP